MKISELSTNEFEKLKKESETKRLLQLLTNVIRPCEGCPIRKECLVSVKNIPR